MGMIVSMVCRTVALQKGLTTTNRGNASGGTEESKEIMFRVACQRKYQSNHKDKDGNQVRGRQTDFFLLRARGQVAQVLNDYATKMNGDKLVSRFLSVEGTFETYQKDMAVEISETVPLKVAGKVYNVPVKLETTKKVTNTIFNCSSIEFLDSSNDKENSSTPVKEKKPMEAIELSPDMLAKNLKEALNLGEDPVPEDGEETVQEVLEEYAEDANKTSTATPVDDSDVVPFG